METLKSRGACRNQWKATDTNLDFYTQGLQTRKDLPRETEALAPNLNFPSRENHLSSGWRWRCFWPFYLHRFRGQHCSPMTHISHHPEWPVTTGERRWQLAHQSCLSSSIFPCLGPVLIKLLCLLSSYIIQPCRHMSCTHTHGPMLIDVYPRDRYRHTTMYTHHSETHTPQERTHTSQPYT